MHVIVYRERPSQPWTFVTYHSGTAEQAEESAQWTEEQERRVFGRTQAEARVITEAQFDSGQKIGGRRRRARPQASAKISSSSPGPVVVSQACEGRGTPASIDEIKAMLEG